MSRCRSCWQEIRWIVTPDGKRMPVDAEPVWVREAMEGETPRPFLDRKGNIVNGIMAGDAWEGKAEEVFVSHFATCPQAAKWRKER